MIFLFLPLKRTLTQSHFLTPSWLHSCPVTLALNNSLLTLTLTLNTHSDLIPHWFKPILALNNSAFNSFTTEEAFLLISVIKMVNSWWIRSVRWLGVTSLLVLFMFFIFFVFLHFLRMFLLYLSWISTFSSRFRTVTGIGSSMFSFLTFLLVSFFRIASTSLYLNAEVHLFCLQFLA